MSSPSALHVLENGHSIPCEKCGASAAGNPRSARFGLISLPSVVMGFGPTVNI